MQNSYHHIVSASCRSTDYAESVPHSVVYDAYFQSLENHYGVREYFFISDKDRKFYRAGIVSRGDSIFHDT